MVLHTSAELADQLEKVKRLESNLTFRLALISKLLDQQVHDLLHDTPLNLTGYRIVRVVDTFEAISISDIGRRTAIDRAQISRSVAELVKQGLVEYRADPESRRKKLAALTAEGKALLKSIDPRFETRRQALVEGLGPEDEEALKRGLEKLGRVISA